MSTTNHAPTIPADAVAAGAASLNAAHWKERNRLEAVNAALVAALDRFVAAAKSWHDTHNHEGSPAQCDWLCACIAPGEAALKAAQESSHD